MLGISPIYVSELVHAFKLPAISAGRQRRFELHNVIAFDAAYVLSTELNAKLDRTQRGGADYYLQASAFSTRHLRAWRRQELYEFLSELDRQVQNSTSGPTDEPVW